MRDKMRYTETLAPWKQRLCEEYWELDKKIKKLINRISYWDDNGEIDYPSYNLMSAQLACMISYKSILAERAACSGNIDLIKWRDENEEKE